MLGSQLAVVIPAWNEEQTLGRCLATVVEQDVPGPATVVVVANGCTDRTAAVARGFKGRARERGIDFRVLDLPVAGKPAALNAGDAWCPQPSHRIYLDADVRLAPGALAALSNALDAGAMFAAPALVLDDSNSSTAGRAYWRCWTQLPNVRGQVIGAGAYGVSAHGRARWEGFPGVIADDLYARSHFASGECTIVHSVTFTTDAPSSTTGTLRMLVRWRAGNVQLRKLLFGQRLHDVYHPLPTTSLRDAVAVMRAHTSLTDIAIFLFMTLSVRLLAALPQRKDSWSRGR